MNWCSRPRPKLDLSFCAGSQRKEDTITIDVPEVPAQQFVVENGTKFSRGSVSIDSKGLKKKVTKDPARGSQAAGAHAGVPPNRASKAMNGASQGPRDSQTDGGWTLGGSFSPLQMRASRRSRESPERQASPSRMSRSSLEMKRGQALQAARGSGGPWLAGRASVYVPQRVQLSDLIKLKGMSSCLGKGVSGTVWKVMDQSVKEILALKEMTYEADDDKCRLIIQEMQIMLELDHPHIVACHGVFFDKGMFQIVMEFMDGGSLLDMLRQGDHKVEPFVLQSIAKQVLLAMVYLHREKRVIHRDVKPGNILLNLRGEVKLADFGVASSPRDTRESQCATWVGTVTYMSPERITGEKYGFNADVWAVGVIMVEAALGKYPYLTEDMVKKEGKQVNFWDLLHVMLNDGCASRKLVDTGGYPDFSNFRSFTEALLDKDHVTRPSAMDALQHPWMASCSPDLSTRVSRWVNCGTQERRGAEGVRISQRLKNLSLDKAEDSLEGDGWL